MGTLLRTVEAAYRLASPDTEWLRELSRGLAEAWGVGGLGARFRWPERDSIEVLDIANAGLAPEVEASIVEAAGVATQTPALRMLYRGLHVATMTQRFEEHQGDLPSLLEHYQRRGIADLKTLVGADPNGTGFLFTAPVEPSTVSPAEERRILPVAAHVTAAIRLRLRPDAKPEAIFDPERGVVHAEGEGIEAREALSHACRAIDAARARASSDEALGIWTALVEGRWSVIDREERDGRRFLLAVPNLPETQARFALTRRELHLVELAATGRSLKLIAYETGLAPSTVSSTLSLAMTKLAVPNRAALVDLVHRARPLSLPSPSEEPVEVKLPDTRFPDHLTPRERQLADEVAAGRSDAQIAAAFGTSANTVRKQLRSLYAKLAVSSRTELVAALRRDESAN